MRCLPFSNVNISRAFPSQQSTSYVPTPLKINFSRARSSQKSTSHVPAPLKSHCPPHSKVNCLPLLKVNCMPLSKVNFSRACPLKSQLLTYLPLVKVDLARACPSQKSILHSPMSLTPKVNFAQLDVSHVKRQIPTNPNQLVWLTWPKRDESVRSSSVQSTVLRGRRV